MVSGTVRFGGSFTDDQDDLVPRVFMNDVWARAKSMLVISNTSSS
jgi:hypothetical protein